MPTLHRLRPSLPVGQTLEKLQKPTVLQSTCLEENTVWGPRAGIIFFTNVVKIPQTVLALEGFLLPLYSKSPVDRDRWVSAEA